MNLAKIIIAWAIAFGVVVGIPVANAGCHHLYRQQVVVAPYVQPLVLYSTGEALVAEAKIAKEVERQLALRAPVQQQQAAPIDAFSRKCTRCHKGETSLTSDPATFKRFARMAGLGEGVPKEMTAVIAGLSPAEKGELTEYLLRLPAKPEPQVTVPQPEETGVLR